MRISSFILKAGITFMLLNNYSLLPALTQIEDGASASEIGKCNVKSCFINLLMIHESEILKQHKNSDGTFDEIYRLKIKNDLSLNDYTKMVVSSGNPGLWNIVNYPIEGYISDNTHIIFKSAYNDKEEAIKIELQLPE